MFVPRLTQCKPPLHRCFNFIFFTLFITNRPLFPQLYSLSYELVKILTDDKQQLSLRGVLHCWTDYIQFLFFSSNYRKLFSRSCNLLRQSRLSIFFYNLVIVDNIYLTFYRMQQKVCSKYKTFLFYLSFEKSLCLISSACPINKKITICC